MQTRLQRRIDRVIEPASYTRRERGVPPRSALVSHIKSSDTRSAAEEENIGSGATRACEGHAGNGARGKRPSSARIFSSTACRRTGLRHGGSGCAHTKPLQQASTRQSKHDPTTPTRERLRDGHNSAIKRSNGPLANYHEAIASRYPNQPEQSGIIRSELDMTSRSRRRIVASHRQYRIYTP